MLVLYRKPGQELYVETPLGRIVVVAMGGNRLGIDAPAAFTVLRAELVKGKGAEGGAPPPAGQGPGMPTYDRPVGDVA